MSLRQSAVVVALGLTLLAGCADPDPVVPLQPLPGDCQDGLCILPESGGLVQPLYETTNPVTALAAADNHVMWYAGKWYGLDLDTRVVRTMDGPALSPAVAHGWQVAGIQDNHIVMIDLAAGTTTSIFPPVSGRLQLLDFNDTHFLAATYPQRSYDDPTQIILIDDNVTTVRSFPEGTNLWGHLDPWTWVACGEVTIEDGATNEPGCTSAVHHGSWGLGFANGTGRVGARQVAGIPVATVNGTWLLEETHYNAVRLTLGYLTQQYVATNAPHSFVGTNDRAFAILPGTRDAIVEIRA